MPIFSYINICLLDCWILRQFWINTDREQCAIFQKHRINQSKEPTTHQSSTSSLMISQSIPRSSIVHRKDNSSHSKTMCVSRESSIQSVKISFHDKETREKPSKLNHAVDHQKQTMTFEDLDDCSSLFEKSNTICFDLEMPQDQVTRSESKYKSPPIPPCSRA